MHWKILCIYVLVLSIFMPMMCGFVLSGSGLYILVVPREKDIEKYDNLLFVFIVSLILFLFIIIK